MKVERKVQIFLAVLLALYAVLVVVLAHRDREQQAVAEDAQKKPVPAHFPDITSSPEDSSELAALTADDFFVFDEPALMPSLEWNEYCSLVGARATYMSNHTTVMSTSSTKKLFFVANGELYKGESLGDEKTWGEVRLIDELFGDGGDADSGNSDTDGLDAGTKGTAKSSAFGTGIYSGDASVDNSPKTDEGAANDVGAGSGFNLDAVTTESTDIGNGVDDIYDFDSAYYTAGDTAIAEPVVAKNGDKLYWTLENIRDHLDMWFTQREIRIATLITQAEDEIACSDTIWSAHVWCYLNRIGHEGFVNNDDLEDVLSDRTQFPTWTEENLSKEIDPEIEEIVRDVFARSVYETMGAPDELVGRTLPKDVCFFRSPKDKGKYNWFYYETWNYRYDPFDSPYNPYSD